MVLVDTSIWIDHLRGGDRTLARLLETARVACHVHVIGELALGSLKDRRTVLAQLKNLPRAPLATPDEVLTMIDYKRLAGRGVGYTDAHLLAGTLLDPDMRLWTRDKPLNAAAADLGIIHHPER